MPHKTMSVEEILHRSETLFFTTERTNAENQWDEIATFVLNNQSGIFKSKKDSPGQKKTDRVYDSTAIQANHDLASTIHSTLTNPATKWSRIRFKDPILNNNPEAIAWLEDANNKIHDSIGESNFDTEIAKSYKMFCSIGNMALFQDVEASEDAEGPEEKFKFKSLHMAEAVFAENANGKIDTVFRKFKMTIKQILEQFPDAPKDLMEMNNIRLDDELEILHAIFPRAKTDIKLNKAGLAPGKKRPFASFYIMLGGERNMSRVLEESGYYEFPVHAVRWETLPGEIYGRGPGHIGLPDIRTLNTVKKLGLQALARAVNPPLQAKQRNVIGDVNLRPGGITVTRDGDGLKEFITGTRFDVTNFAVEDLRTSIRNVFFLDKLALPPRTETGEMTAFEIQQRVEQMQRVLGPTLGRLNSELLQPLIVRTFKMMLRANKFAELPEILLEVGLDVDITFINQLARSQKIEDVTNIQAWAQDVSNLAQLNPKALDYIDVDEAVKHIAKIRGVPEIVVANDGEVKAIREQRAQQQQAQQMLDAGTQIADIASKAGTGEE